MKPGKKVNWRFARYTDAMITCVVFVCSKVSRSRRRKSFFPKITLPPLAT